MYFYFLYDIDRLKAKKKIKKLHKALKYPEWKYRDAAASALGEIGDLQSVTPLISNINDEEDTVRCSIIVALGKIGGPQAFEAIKDKLHTDRSLGVRAMAAWTLGEIGNPEAIEALLLQWNKMGLHPYTTRVRESIENAILKIGKPAIESILKFLVEKYRPDFSSKDYWAYYGKFIVKWLDDFGWQPDDSEAGREYRSIKYKRLVDKLSLNGNCPYCDWYEIIRIKDLSKLRFKEGQLSLFGKEDHQAVEISIKNGQDDRNSVNEQSTLVCCLKCLRDFDEKEIIKP